MNKEEFLKAIENVPKTDSINPISAYNSINVEDLANAVDRFKKVPTYDELLKENQKYKEVIDKLKELIESKNNGVCVINGKEKEAFTFLLDFDKAREFIWKLLDILKEVE